MRILNVVPWLAPRYGGPAIAVPQASVGLARRGHYVEIVSTNTDYPGVLDVPTGRIVDWGGAATTFHSTSVPRRYLTSWSMLSDLRRRASAFDVIHIHCLYRFHGLAAAAVARSQGVPYVIQAHGSLDPWHRQRRRRSKDIYHAMIEDPIIRGASAMICTSRREELSIRGLGYSVPTWIIPIGIDTGELRTPGIPDVVLAERLGPDAQIVTFLGRISAKKGVPLLLDSFRIVAAAVPNAHLVVAGPDDEGIGRGLMPLIADAGLSDRVTFLGAAGGPEKRALLQGSDVFVLPSADESFGIAVAEAMAVGCPVVVSSDVAIQDVVRASGAGIVVERSPSAVAGAIATILSAPGQAATMGEAGRRAVDERFSCAIIAERTEAVYEAVLRVGKRARRLSATRPTPRTHGSHVRLGFRCPCCRNALVSMGSDVTMTCETCAWTGSTVDGIPVLLPQPSATEHDELDHDHGHGHKAAQAAHFDQSEAEDFEAARPHGTARMYRFLLGEKFRRAVGPIRPHLAGASVLTVCGGSGMDAEYFARIGPHVISSDLSLGAAKRAKGRSQRYDLGIESIVADVEHLPFADQSVDVVAVHDGLHHLDDPYAGLSEMARVARCWVVVTEPARALATQAAVNLGLALETEKAGNRVARMEPAEVVSFLETRGFVVLRAERYAMYYPHRPGATFSLLSRPIVFPIVRVGLSLANALVGRFGNKMVVVAERRGSEE